MVMYHNTYQQGGWKRWLLCRAHGSLIKANMKTSVEVNDPNFVYCDWFMMDQQQPYKNGCYYCTPMTCIGKTITVRYVCVIARVSTTSCQSEEYV